MSKVTIRMKNKMLSKVHLDKSGAMVISPIKATSDMASKGIMAQPQGPLTEEANLGNPGLAPHELIAIVGEPAAGGSAERVAPDTMPEKDIQPPMKDLLVAPSQKSPEVKRNELLAELALVEAVAPAAGAPATAPNESLDTVTSDKVLVNETFAPITLKDASQSVGGKKEKD